MLNESPRLPCPHCAAAPGTPHSLYCSNPDEFARREGEREAREWTQHQQDEADGVIRAGRIDPMTGRYIRNA